MELYWTDSGISRIDRNCFTSLKNIQIINLSGNKIENIEPHTFVGLKKLERIYLNRNRLATINLRHLSNLPRLTYLDISKNQVPIINVEELWRSVPSLETVIIDRQSDPLDSKKDYPKSLNVILV